MILVSIVDILKPPIIIEGDPVYFFVICRSVPYVNMLSGHRKNFRVDAYYLENFNFL